MSYLVYLHVDAHGKVNIIKIIWSAEKLTGLLRQVLSTQIEPAGFFINT